MLKYPVLAFLRLVGGGPGSLELPLLRLLKCPAWEQTIANNITMARARLGFWGVHGFYWSAILFSAVHWLLWGAFLSLVFAALLDILDGIIARKLRCESDFGRFIDPFADKAIVWSAFIVLLHHHRMAPWLVIPTLGIVVYDIAVSRARMRNSTMRTNIVAKIKQWPLDTGIIALLLGILFDWDIVNGLRSIVPEHFPSALQPFGGYALWVSFGLACISAYVYYKKKLLKVLVRVKWLGRRLRQSIDFGVIT